MCTVDPVEDSKDWRRLQRAKEVAEMVLGKDASQVIFVICPAAIRKHCKHLAVMTATVPVLMSAVRPIF